MHIDDTGSRTGFLVVGRSRHKEQLARRPANSYLLARKKTVEEIETTYAGFDGEVWPLECGKQSLEICDGLAPLSNLRATEEYYKKARSESICDLLILDFSSEIWESARLPTYFEFVGFDFGVYATEYNYFSVLFHEVIFGQNDELRAFGLLLNPHLLFASTEVVGKVLKARELLSKSNDVDLETFEPEECLEPVAIYRYVRSADSMGTRR